MPESFIFYESFYDAIELLPPEEQLEAYRAIMAYALKDEEIKLFSIGAKMAFILAKPNIDSAKTKRANGKKGGRPEKETVSTKKKEAEKQSEQVKVSKNESKVSENKLNGLENEKPMVIENENQWLKKHESNVDVDVDVDEDVDVDVDEDDDVDVDEDVAGAVDDDDDEDVEKNSASASDGGEESGGTQSGDLVDFVFYKTTPEVVALVKQYTNDLFQRYRPKRIVSIDYQNVIDKVQTLACTEDGEHYADFDQQKAALLEYAFEQAAAVDKVNWKYIDGIYSNFAERGIETLEDAQEYEFKRQNGYSQEELMQKLIQ